MGFIPSSNVRLLSSIPLDNNYSHQMDFPSKTDQTTYFSGKISHSFNDFTYVRETGVIKVPKGRDNLYNINYLMFMNDNFTNKWFYAFVTQIDYINPNTSAIHFEIDVYQTWMFDYSWKPSYVVREHAKRWNTDGTPVINTLDEGLDYGSAYETVKVENYNPFDNILFLVIISKSTLHNDASETPEIKEKEIRPIMNGLPQPLSYYVHPFKSDGSNPAVTVNGETKTLSSIMKVLENMFTMDSTVNNIVNMYVTNHIGRYVAYDGSTIGFDSVFKPVTIADNVHENMTTLYCKEMDEYHEITKDMGNKYDGFNTVDESKLLMYPYTLTILDDLKGNRIELKNEYIGDKNLNLRVKGSMGIANKVVYSVDNYLTHSNVDFEGMTNVSLENSVVDNNPNDIPVISDYLSAFMQGNRNALLNQQNSMLFQSVAGAIGGASVGGMFGGVGGAVGGAGGSLANSYFQIQGLNAKIKDINNVPPTLAKLGSNVNFDYGNGLRGIFVIKKQITKEYRDRLTSYFKMFGYKVNELKTPDLKSRESYNYIQVASANLVGNIPHDNMNRLKQMFQDGVTIWHTTDVENYVLRNDEI